MNFRILAAVAALTMGFCSLASAQTVETGQAEALGFVGGLSDGGGVTFGGGLQYAIQPKWLFSGEFGYATGASKISGPGYTIDDRGITVDANVTT